MEKIKDAFAGPMRLEDTVCFKDRNQLVADMDLGKNTGYAVLPDGTGYVSDITYMQGVTADMIDWYIAWRGQQAENYASVNPEKHISALSMQGDKFTDEDLTGPEKYWDTTQIVVQKGEMGPVTEFVNFKCPADVGFDMGKAENKKLCGLICERVYAQGQPPQAGPDTFVCHQIIQEENGVEIRSKYWIGWTVRYGKDYKQLPDGFYMPPVLALGTLIKNKQEMAALAKVLPELYAGNYRQGALR